MEPVGLNALLRPLHKNFACLFSWQESPANRKLKDGAKVMLFTVIVILVVSIEPTFSHKPATSESLARSG